jgi:hypothetical protein
MKNNPLKKTLRILKLKLKKATSYNVVKSKLNYRLYSHDLLSNRMMNLGKINDPDLGI